MLALSAVGTASASAAECPGTGGGVVLCSGGHVQEGTFAFTGKQVPETEKELEVAAISTRPRCSGAAKSKGQLVATKENVEVTNLVIEWTNCTIPAEATCKVKTIIFDGGEGLGTGSGLKGALAGSEELTLSPMSGAEVTVVRITGCLKAAEWLITGQQKCTLPGSSSEALVHRIACSKSGSNLKLSGTKVVSFAAQEEIQLSSGKAFSLQKG